MAVSKIPIYLVEAFTTGNNDAYTGNPAAVCFLNYDDDISTEIMQKIATTMNVSVTVFVSLDWTKNPDTSETTTKTPTSNNALHRKLRWFTPIMELEICGHATVAAVQAVVEHLAGTETKEIEFESKFTGLLPAKLTPATEFKLKPIEDQGDFVTLNFPLRKMEQIPLTNESKPSEEEGFWLSSVVRNAIGPLFPFEGDNLTEVVEDVQFVREGSFFLILLKQIVDEIPSITIQKVQPNIQKLMEPIKDLEIGIPHVVIVAVQGDNFDTDDGEGKGPHFYSRFFEPYYGLDEDPVCGSGHAAITPYWVKKLGLEKGMVLWGRQASPRGGDLRCQLVTENHGDGEQNTRVLVSGRARIITKGELNI